MQKKFGAKKNNFLFFSLILLVNCFLVFGVVGAVEAQATCADTFCVPGNPAMCNFGTGWCGTLFPICSPAYPSPLCLQGTAETYQLYCTLLGVCICDLLNPPFQISSCDDQCCKDWMGLTFYCDSTNTCVPIPACDYLSCERVNADFPCACGTRIADAANPWCCSLSNAVYSTQGDCCDDGGVGACKDIDGDLEDSEACGGNDCDDNNICVNSGMIEAEGFTASNPPCPHLPAGSTLDTCADGVDNDCDGLTDRCHDPDCDCAGGIVPCGRHGDDPTTAVLEDAPCTLCHIFLLIKKVIDLLLVYILIPLATFGLIVTGVLFLSAAGDPNQVGQAKTALKVIGGGLVLSFIVWILMELFITTIVPSSRPWRDWKSLSCPVAPCVTDGTCDTVTGEDSQNCPTDCPCNFDGDDCSPSELIVAGPQACPDCAVCGNGTVDVGEYCDPTPLVIRGGVNPVGGCTIYGYSAGDLDCADDCRIDLSGCAR